jgi:hypothetical protein
MAQEPESKDQLAQPPTPVRPSNPAQPALPSAPGGPSLAPGAKKTLTEHQRTALDSAFSDSTALRQRAAILAGGPAHQNPGDEESTAINVRFDGKKVPPTLQDRNVWRAVQAPLQSREARRTSDLYDMVVKQFGVTVNPRYEDDAPGKIRGHIFVWDVSRAMNCEIPHFTGAKELSLAQTCDWLRHEGPMRGWRRVTEQDIIKRANKGFMVVALPKETRTKHLALVLPQAAPADNSPRLTGIALLRDVNVHPREMFGARAIDCFSHD